MNIHNPDIVNNPIIVIDEDHDELRLLADAHEDLGIKNPLVTFDACEPVMAFIETMKVAPLLIICDFRFRTMDGLQLRKQLLEHHNSRFGAIPFVIWSSVKEPLHVQLAEDVDIYGFYVKPLTFSELQNIYTSIIRQWGLAKGSRMLTS